MKTRTQIAFATLIGVLVITLASTLFPSQQASAAPPPESAPVVSPTNAAPLALTNAAPPQVLSTNGPNPVVKKQLTGAELYSINCNRCHPERYPTERTAAQWKTIMLHMRVRANLPASQSRLILKYLQENSGR